MKFERRRNNSQKFIDAPEPRTFFIGSNGPYYAKQMGSLNMAIYSPGCDILGHNIVGKMISDGLDGTFSAIHELRYSKAGKLEFKGMRLGFEDGGILHIVEIDDNWTEVKNEVL